MSFCLEVEGGNLFGASSLGVKGGCLQWTTN